MSERKKQGLQTEIERLEKKQAFHQQEAQKSAARLKEILNQNRNNHLMAFGIGVEQKYLSIDDSSKQKIKEEYREIYANDQRMLQRVLDGFDRLDKQIVTGKAGRDQTEKAMGQKEQRVLISLGLSKSKAEEICQRAKDTGTDLIELLDNAGKVFDAKPEEIRKSTRERYLLGTLKKALNIEF